MPLAKTAEIVADAYARGAGVASLNVVLLEHITAIIDAAENRNRPVILQVSHNALRYHGSLGPIGSAMLAAAGNARVPVAVHLDHAESPELVREAVALGFSSVMFDASTSDYAANVRATAGVVAHCHERDIWVEAELGEIGGKNGVHAPGARTDPAEAARFVAATGVDALAVAVGTSHAMLTRDAELDFGLIARLRAAVPVPLVLHGSSGVDDAGLGAAVRAGLTKINIATRLNAALTAAARRHIDAHPAVVDPRKYLGPARAAVSAEIEHLLDVLGT
ncbi:class II fructose-bisphosphate aldolase [Saccharopolyspora sp. NPDC050389]|uniref:class II fructose-bisphosphate aldolase n=1 Tax=Saccharopolyspora sp. NPDC050389 TaxID=3155516 RepID=UPI0033CC23E5